MPRQINQGDIEVAQNLLSAQRDPAQITAVLVYRGLDEQTATRLVEDLKQGRRVTVQPADTPNTTRDSPPGPVSSVVNPSSGVTRPHSHQWLMALVLVAGVAVLVFYATRPRQTSPQPDPQPATAQPAKVPGTKPQWTDENLLHFTSTLTKQAYADVVYFGPSKGAIVYDGDLYWCAREKCLLVPSSGLLTESYVLFPEATEVFIVRGESILARGNERGILKDDLSRADGVMVRELGALDAGKRKGTNLSARRYEFALLGVASWISVMAVIDKGDGPGFP